MTEEEIDADILAKMKYYAKVGSLYNITLRSSNYHPMGWVGQQTMTFSQDEDVRYPYITLPLSLLDRMAEAKNFRKE